MTLTAKHQCLWPFIYIQDKNWERERERERERIGQTNQKQAAPLHILNLGDTSNEVENLLKSSKSRQWNTKKWMTLNSAHFYQIVSILYFHVLFKYMYFKSSCHAKTTKQNKNIKQKEWSRQKWKCSASYLSALVLKHHHCQNTLKVLSAHIYELWHYHYLTMMGQRDKATNHPHKGISLFWI
jgi:hypothetical protein